MMLSPARYVLHWWRLLLNPGHANQRIRERLNNQEVRIEHLEKRVAEQEAELQVLHQRMDELSEQVSNFLRREL